MFVNKNNNNEKNISNGEGGISASYKNIIKSILLIDKQSKSVFLSMWVFPQNINLDGKHCYRILDYLAQT